MRWHRFVHQVMLMVFSAFCNIGSSSQTISRTTMKVGVLDTVVFDKYSLCMPQLNDTTMIKMTDAHLPPTNGSSTTT
jgi:hypothetical protein